MNDLKALQSMGLVLPSPAYILGAIIFGLIGYAVFRRGRKTTQPTLTWTGVAMMLYPYAISQTWLLWAIYARALPCLTANDFFHFSYASFS